MDAKGLVPSPPFRRCKFPDISYGYEEVETESEIGNPAGFSGGRSGSFGNGRTLVVFVDDGSDDKAVFDPNQ